ncbi:MAG: DUF1800 domain-containing protein [Pseudomonadota bacterium]
MTVQQAFIAATRFGLGAKPGEIVAARSDPRGWLTQQLEPVPPPPALADLAPGSQRMNEFQVAVQRGPAAVEESLRGHLREVYQAEAAARTKAQIDSDTPFRERLTALWGNHFTVSVQRPPLLGLAGAFEREAIRPHVTGRFFDLLLAAVRHPGMLVYLDQARSIGPTSRVGLTRGRGLNENLAREILELHTLGVTAGYTQADVREFAKILTGWSIGRPTDGDEAGTYRYVPQSHEPGGKTLLGVRYAETGEVEGRDALNALARHPATAVHIATKFARHFIADQPPEDAVRRLARVFLDRDGDLKALSEAVVDAPEAWAEALPKIKTPNEFVVSALRATAVETAPGRLLGALRRLGQAPFAAPSPAGWPDTAAAWIGPDAVLRRAESAVALAERAGRWSPDALLAEAIGPVVSRATALAAARAPSRAEGIAMVLASPEFQRR